MLTGKNGVRILISLLIGIITMSISPCYGQDKKQDKRKKNEPAVSIIDQRPEFKVQGGLRTEIIKVPVKPDSVIMFEIDARLDSLVMANEGVSRDSLVALGHSLGTDTLIAQRDSLPEKLIQAAMEADSLHVIFAKLHSKLHDTVGVVTAAPPQDSTFMAVRRNRKGEELDSLGHRHSIVVKEGLVRDSIPLSKLTLLSAVIPGYAQIYEGNYWKAAAGYVAMGVPLALSFKQNKEYKDYKKQYDALIMSNASRTEIDPIQTEMIKHNTYRQLLWAGTALSYMALLADGVYNYPSDMSDIKKATTLSTIMPGAGQFYNGSYWRIPFVVGAFASIGYVIDWNNRGYQRFKLAHDLVADGNDATVDEFNGRYTASFLRNMKNQYRRNRDLAIIGTAAVYLLNIIDAHVDAHLKDFDVSDDLTLNVSPEFKTHGIYGGSSINNTMGFNLNFTF